MLLLDLEVTPRDVMMLLDLEVTSWGLEATVRPSPLSPSPDEGWSTGNIFWLPCPGVGMGGTSLAQEWSLACSLNIYQSQILRCLMVC